MITPHIIKKIEKELKDRDDTISRLTRKVKELESIKDDWISSELCDKKFPDDYIKQKEEVAEIRTFCQERVNEYSEILKQCHKKHKKEVDRLKFEIELLEKRLPKDKLFKNFWRI